MRFARLVCYCVVKFVVKGMNIDKCGVSFGWLADECLVVVYGVVECIEEEVRL